MAPEIATAFECSQRWPRKVPPVSSVREFKDLTAAKRTRCVDKSKPQNNRGKLPRLSGNLQGIDGTCLNKTGVALVYRVEQIADVLAKPEPSMR